MSDLEIEAMSSVTSALSDLDGEAKGRVLRWAADRYGITLGKDGRRGVRTNDHADVETDEEAHESVNDGVEPNAYEDVAELYDAAGPKNDEGKLLVAAYWRQKMQGQVSFQALDLNRDLKNLGHGVGSIAHVLARSTQKKPALVLQLRKSGNSKQARKTYKLTGEGLKTVERMIRKDR
jgi:hypothetical protein